MEHIKEKFKSIRIKLFLTLCIVVIIIIAFLILTNNFVLESFYLYTKMKTLNSIYERINNYYIQEQTDSTVIELELEKAAINNNFDILIQSENNISVYSTNRDFLSSIKELNAINTSVLQQRKNIVYKNDKVIIRKFEDKSNGITFMMFSAKLDNGYQLYIRMPFASIRESVSISNNFLYLIGGFTILIGGIVVSFISKRFTSPILELNAIANKMSKLDFSHKYCVTDTDDEINELGKSINTMSDKLEKTINRLRDSNIELEKDIEEKSKIDEMRKQFISDVSHELKTPIALIQGYSEGLIENVNTDEENRKFYAEVILDEANKMDKLVAQLLELMKLEYGKREFNNKEFDICELIREVIRKSKVMLEERQIEVDFSVELPVYVLADDFYIEQVITNYFTNAIKHVNEKNGKKIIQIRIEQNKQEGTARIYVFNTGEPIEEENLTRIWNRFYKVDESRNREDGGTGIGLSLVKAIMNNYKKQYGVTNMENGVEFYFDLEIVE
ncbi:MAG: HAMP domain-containing protein [Clostridia bacterium]|nr:HAMP domain-containing protein [Clostridia bacterium]